MLFRMATQSPGWFACWLGLLRFLFRLETVGKMPACRPLVFVGNHGSYYDGWFLLAIIREAFGEWPVMLAWCGMKRYLVTRQLLASKALPFIVTPDAYESPNLRATIAREMIEELKHGNSLCVHAEGSVLDRLGRFQPGAAFAAMETGTPIVPFTLCGVQALWDEVPFPRRFWGRVTIYFHPVVDPADYSHLAPREAITAMTSEVRRRVASVIDYPVAEIPE